MGDWEKRVSVYSKLKSIGFNLEIDDSMVRLRVARFTSKVLLFECALDLTLGEVTSRWIDRATGNGVPDPLFAICYFRSDFNELIKGNGHFTESIDKTIAVTNIYLENEWVFNSIEWSMNYDFVSALKKADEWAWKEFRPIHGWEFEMHLNKLSQRSPHKSA